MRFTDVQVALFHAGIRFVHLAPDQKRRDQAERDFRAGAKKMFGEEPQRLSEHSLSSAFSFIVCTLSGASVDHVPVMFVEDPDDCEWRPLREAQYIPAPDSHGCGPMVIQ